MAEVIEKSKVSEVPKITLTSAYKAAWKKYSEFNGRLSRKGYWYFVLANFLCALVLTFLDSAFFDSEADVGPLRTLYTLVMFLPSIAAVTRRLHDVNKSGWFQLLHLLPVVGSIVILVFMFQKGELVENQYGPVAEE